MEEFEEIKSSYGRVRRK